MTTHNNIQYFEYIIIKAMKQHEKNDLQIFKLWKVSQFTRNRSTQVISLQISVEDRSTFTLNNKQRGLVSYKIQNSDVTTSKVIWITNLICKSKTKIHRDHILLMHQAINKKCKLALSAINLLFWWRGTSPRQGPSDPPWGSKPRIHDSSYNNYVSGTLLSI